MITEMLTKDEFKKATTSLPCRREYKSVAERLTALSEICDIYIPSDMSMEIYCKLYTAVLRSVQRKNTRSAVLQSYRNRSLINKNQCTGIMGGSDSFAVIGSSGLGKSSAISKAASLITSSDDLIPCLTIQCPFDCSVKGMLFEILRMLDTAAGTDYYVNAVKIRATTDMLIGSVSQACLEHIGLLVIDEIQNVVKCRNGSALIGALTQLINNSGISVCMVGTPECAEFFESTPYLARRAFGLRYTDPPFDAYFEEFCKTVFSFQYTEHHTEITPAIIQWLYVHSSGLASHVISLIHDAQEKAILSGTERLDIGMLNMAFDQRMETLHSHILTGTSSPPAASAKKRGNSCKKESAEIISGEIKRLADSSKAHKIDLISLFKEKFIVEEIKI